VTAKIAIGVAAVALAGGAGYEGVKVVNGPATPTRPAKAAPATPAAVVPVAQQPAADVRTKPVVANGKPIAGKPGRLKDRSLKGKSATAPGHTKTQPKTQGRSATAPGHTKATQEPKGKSEVAPGRTNALAEPKAKVVPGQMKPKPKPKKQPVVTRPEPVRGKIGIPPGQADPVVDVDTKGKKPR
jgi:hypothetical protein